MLRTLFAATALTLATSFMTPAFADEQKPTRTMAVSGHGEVRVPPDMAIVTVGVLSQKATAAEALSDNTAAMQAIFAALKEAGIADKDVQTSNFSVQPRYDFRENQAPQLAGYDVSNTVTIAVRKIDTLGGVLDKVVSAGSNQIHGIQFDVSEPDAAMDEARKLAVADAQRKAGVYAAASSVQLRNIISISEGSGGPSPIIVRAKMMRADAAAPVPIAQGEQALSVDVNIVWEIK